MSNSTLPVYNVAHIQLRPWGGEVVKKKRLTAEGLSHDMPLLLVVSIAATAVTFRISADTQTGADDVYAVVTDKDGNKATAVSSFTPVSGTTTIFSVDIPYQPDDARAVAFNSSSDWSILSLEVEGSAGFVRWLAIYGVEVVSSATVASGDLPLFFNPAIPPVILKTETADSNDADSDAPSIVTLTDVYGDTCQFMYNPQKTRLHPNDEFLGYTWCPNWLGGDQVESIHFNIQLVTTRQRMSSEHTDASRRKRGEGLSHEMPFLLAVSIAVTAVTFRFSADTQAGANEVYAIVTDKDGNKTTAVTSFTPVSGTTTIFSVDVPYQADDVRSLSFNSSSDWIITSLAVEGSAGFVQWQAIVGTSVVSSATASAGDEPLFFNPDRPPVILLMRTGDSQDANSYASSDVTVTDVYGETCTLVVNPLEKHMVPHADVLEYTWCSWRGGGDQVELIFFAIGKGPGVQGDFWHVVSLKVYRARSSTWYQVYRDGTSREFKAFLKWKGTGGFGRLPTAQWQVYHTLLVTAGSNTDDATANELKAYGRFATEVFDSPSMYPATPGATYETAMKGTDFMEAGLELMGASDALEVVSVLHAATALDYFEGRLTRLYTFNVTGQSEPPFPESSGSILDPARVTGHPTRPFRATETGNEVALQFEISTEAEGMSYCVTAVFDDLSTLQLGTLFSPSVAGMRYVRTLGSLYCNTGSLYCNTGSLYCITCNTGSLDCITANPGSLYCITCNTGSLYCITRNTGSLYCITANTGSLYCITCNTGSLDCITANPGSLYCITCNTGSLYCITRNTGSLYCITCNTGSLYCITCNTGTLYCITPNTGSLYCITPNPGSLYCITCNTGSLYCITPNTGSLGCITPNPGSLYCITCNTGTLYCITPNTGSLYCITCNTGSLYCITCNTGTLYCITPNTGSLDCITPNTGSLYCITCNTGSLYCITCNTGTLYCITPNTGSLYCITPNPGSLYCITCNTGSLYCITPNTGSLGCITPNPGSLYCITCNTGSLYCITPNPGSLYCITCNTGTLYCITSNTGSLYCITCNTGSLYCITCNTGTLYCITPNTGSLDCITPNTGSLYCITCNTGSLYCITCNTGTLYCITPNTGSLGCITPNPGSLYCITCNTGSLYCITPNTGPLYCITCNTGSLDCITPNTGSLYCITCNTGSLYCITCNTGTLYCITPNTGSLGCITPNPGSLYCITCNTGSLYCITPNTGPLYCTTCNTGSLNCVTSNTGSFNCITSNTGSLYCVTCNTGPLYCITLNAGSLYSITCNPGSLYRVTCNTGSLYSITCNTSSLYRIATSTGSLYCITSNTGSLYCITSNTGSLYCITCTTGSLYCITSNASSNAHIGTLFCITTNTDPLYTTLNTSSLYRIATNTGSLYCSADLLSKPTTTLYTPEPAFVLGASDLKGELMEDSEAKSVSNAVDMIVPVASAASLFGSAASGQRAVRFVLLTSGCYTNTLQEQPMPFALDPLGLHYQRGMPVAALLGNCILMVAACVLSFVLLKAAQQCKPAASQSDLQGVLRLPAVVMLAGRVLYASSVLAAARLFIHTPHFGFLVLAMLICMACVMTPVVLFWKLKTGVPEKTLFVEDGKFTSKRVTSLVLGPGEWVNKSSETHWVARYGAMFKEYERGTVWWTSFEMVFDFMLAVVSAMETDGAVACGHVKFACGILCLMRLVCLLLVRPYSRGMSFAADAVASAMECAATLLVAVSMYAGRGRDFWLADAAATLLATAAVVWGIGVVLDLGAEAYVVCSGRRRRLQNLSLKLPEEGDHALECFLSEPAVLESTVSESEQVSSASGTFRTMSNRSARPPLSLDATLLRISSPSSTLSPPAEARFTPRHSLPAALRPVPSGFNI
ncbi:putative PPE family protein PPE40 [Diplonema papillatum]|nr:putative PPE family protein PPE40 [Diplonema papillatum]